MKIVLDENGNVLGTHKHELTKTHKQPQEPPPKGNTTEPVRLVKCDICNTTLLPERLEAHRKQCEQRSRLQQLRSNRKGSARRTPKTQLIECKLCGKNLRESQLVQHLAVDHADNLPKAGRLHDVPLSLLLFKADNTKFAYCPYCHQTFSQSDIHQHIRTAHPDRRQRGPTSSPRVQPGDTLVHCPACSVRVRSDRLDKHMRKVHPNQSTKPTGLSHGKSRPAATLVNCPVCSASICKDRLEKHMRKVHGDKTKRQPKQKTRKSPQKQQRDQRRQPRQAESQDTNMAHALREAFHEARDGGKYLGYMTRENGRFGSLPLYDDYGDESDAD